MGRVIILLKHPLTFSFISQAKKNKGSVLKKSTPMPPLPRLKWIFPTTPPPPAQANWPEPEFLNV
jgi:hypothetical protein